MAALITGLVLAALSGLTFLAYRHPRAFAPVGRLLTWVSVAIYMCLSMWDTGVTWAAIELRIYIDPSKMEAAQAAVEGLKVPALWLNVAFFGFLGYLVVLDLLPRLIALTEDDSDSHPSASG
jgi:hypothetical protein